MFADEMKNVRERFPDVALHMLAHSMGGLVARHYVEGDDYAGGVEHLILIGTPNLGIALGDAIASALEVQEHCGLWKHEKDWSPSWMITDGLGEAGRDLKPTSQFLKQLNDRPRRDGVAYTVIAGAQHPIYPMAANALDKSENVIPHRAEKWWGFRQTDRCLHRAAEKLRHKTGKSDGPVSIKQHEARRAWTITSSCRATTPRCTTRSTARSPRRGK